MEGALKGVSRIFCGDLSEAFFDDEFECIAGEISKAPPLTFAYNGARIASRSFIFLAGVAGFAYQGLLPVAS